MAHGRENPNVVRHKCDSELACPHDGSSMTAFTFDKDWHAFSFSGRGSSGAGVWGWLSSLEDNQALATATPGRKGVVARSTDTGAGDLESMCLFNRPNVTLRMDILPRKASYPSIFEVFVDDVLYASVVIPGSTDPLVTDAPVRVHTQALFVPLCPRTQDRSTQNPQKIANEPSLPPPKSIR